MSTWNYNSVISLLTVFEPGTTARGAFRFTQDTRLVRCCSRRSIIHPAGTERISSHAIFAKLDLLASS
jgi:hypothetical protein